MLFIKFLIVEVWGENLWFGDIVGCLLAVRRLEFEILWIFLYLYSGFIIGVGRY